MFLPVIIYTNCNGSHFLVYAFLKTAVVNNVSVNLEKKINFSNKYVFDVTNIFMYMKNSAAHKHTAT